MRAVDTAPPVIVIAPDSFKGSCSSPEAAGSIAEGVRAALGDAAQVRELPMADGGEGTLDALVAAWGGRIAEVATTDALGRPTTGRVGYGSGSARTNSTAPPARLAIIEAADANGLPAVSDAPLRALDADTAGVGALVLAALDEDADEIILCLGGSATSDGGAGLLRALGTKLLDASGEPVVPGARGLQTLHAVDLSGLDPRARRVRWRIACDVDNPLTGPRGAAAVFAPQKGATPEEVRAIDAGLERLARLLADASAKDPAALLQTPGLGAAGGLGLGPVALFDAELEPGAALVADAIGLSDAIAGADLVITGEGRLDAQSLDGKVVSRVLADSGDTPIIVIAGSLALSSDEVRGAGITAAFSIARGPAMLSELQADARPLIAEAAAQVCNAFFVRRGPGDH